MIAGRLPGLNEMIREATYNRYRYGAFKKQWTNYVANFILAARIPPIADPCNLTIRWIEPNARRDLDNIAAGAKFICDALSAPHGTGVFPFDTRKWICSITHEFPEPEKNNPRIEVTLQSIPRT